MTTAYSDTLRDENGRPIAGASIYVYDDNGSLSTLTDDLAAPLANPLTSDEFGNFSFNASEGRKTLDIFFGVNRVWKEVILLGDIPVGGLQSLLANTRAALAAYAGMAAGQSAVLTEAGREGVFVWSTANLSALVTADPQQGVYVAPASAPTGASGAWVRKFSGALDAPWFGAVANDPGTGAFGTDAYPAFAAMAVLSAALAITGYVNGTFYRGGLPCHIPKGGYYCSQSIAPLFTGEVYGDGGKGWGAPTRIRMAAGADGLQMQAHNTSGKTTFDGVTHYAGDRLHIHDIAFIGAYSGTESDTHGIRGKRAGTIERCTFDGFEGDGLYCNTTFGSGIGSTEGNTNAMRVIDCDFQNCRRGRYTEGNDANAIAFIGCSYINNRWAGADEDGFLGNHETGSPHLDGNARTADNTGTAAKPASYCSSGGNRYFVIRGQEAGAATNAPSGTTADNTWWGYMEAGGADATTGVPAYAGGLTWRAGGPVRHNGASNSSSILGVHIESNGVSQIDQGMIMLGTLAQVVRVSGGVLTRDRASTILSSSEGLVIGGSMAVRGDFRGGSPTGNILGPYRGATVVDGTTSFATRNVQHTFEFKTYDAAGVPGAPWLSIPMGSGFGRSNDFGGAMFDRWKFAGVERVKHDNTGVICSGADYYRDANKVVGARVTGWAAATNTKLRTTFDTTTVTLPNLAARVGALIDDLIAHGLIGA